MWRSFFRHPGQPEAGEISGFKQGTDFRHPIISDGPQARETRETIVATQPAGFAEFGGGPLGFAVEGVCGGKLGAGNRVRRTVAARPFEPPDRLVGVRLQQMHEPNLLIKITAMGFAGAKPHRSFGERNRLLDRAGVDLAMGETEECHNPVGIERKQVSYSGMASAYRRCARSTWPLA